MKELNSSMNNDDVVPFSCKHCGSETFRTTTEVKTFEDYLGPICNECGAIVTEDDVKEQAVDIAGKIARDAFKKAGLM